MGHPTPGFRIVILDDDGRELGPGQQGQIAIDCPVSPLYWFRGYRGAPERTAERFVDGRYYLTGDAAYADEDGYIFAVRLRRSDQPRSRSRKRWILPLGVFGSASTNSISRGYLYGAVTALTWA
jgi:non-ribosomal peptide synthetase component E (peptide arylation enzyme)